MEEDKEGPSRALLRKNRRRVPLKPHVTVNCDLKYPCRKTNGQASNSLPPSTTARLPTGDILSVEAVPGNYSTNVRFQSHETAARSKAKVSLLFDGAEIESPSGRAKASG